MCKNFVFNEGVSYKNSKLFKWLVVYKILFILSKEISGHIRKERVHVLFFNKGEWGRGRV